MEPISAVTSLGKTIYPLGLSTSTSAVSDMLGDYLISLWCFKIWSCGSEQFDFRLAEMWVLVCFGTSAAQTNRSNLLPRHLRRRLLLSPTRGGRKDLRDCDGRTSSSTGSQIPDIEHSFIHDSCRVRAPPTMPGSTLIRPRPVDTSKSAVENVLELIPLADIGPVSTSIAHHRVF